MKNRGSVAKAIVKLFQKLSMRRRVQFYGLICLIFIGSLAELAALGSIVPFIAMISYPERFLSYELTGNILEKFGLLESEQIVTVTILLFIALVVIAGLMRMLLAWAGQKFVFRLSHDLGVAVYRKILAQPFAFQISNNTSTLITSIEKVDSVTFDILLPLVRMFTSAFIALFVLGAMLLVSPLLVVFGVVGFGATYLLLNLAMSNRLVSNSKLIAKTKTEQMQTMQEGFGIVRELILNQTRDAYTSRFTRANATLRSTQARNNLIAVSPRHIVETLSIVGIALLAFSLSREPGGLTAALPFLGLLALAAQRILPTVNNLYTGWSLIKGNQQALLDVLNVLELPEPGGSDMSQAAEPLNFEDAIELNRISFRYDKEQDMILDDINLTIKKGSRIAIVGKSGSGKSTVTDIIAGLLSPVSGNISIDGQELNDHNLLNWQRHIAYVPQEIYLGDVSLVKNIAVGEADEKINRDLINKATEQSAISEFIDSLPDKYDTVVGERGVKLSGGQKQRIGIARAIYKQADVLILDEATNALDNQTELEILKAIEAIDKNVTIIVIAHKFSETSMFDEIYCLQNCKLVSKPS